jgi:singapore isolate B (sub-type 7) whole genome shotgun sequence assembly, scaffold_1
MQETSEGKKPSKMDAFDRLQIHQGISDFITSVTNGYMFRQQWQMEHEILNGEQLLDYIVERITLQDTLPRIMQLLCLYSLVNGGLRSKDYDTVRKEIIQVNLE